MGDLLNHSKCLCRLTIYIFHMLNDNNIKRL